MNNVLVTGIGIAQSMDLCDACGLDYSWLASNPSTFIWADKIYLPKGEHFNTETKHGKAAKLIFDIASSEGLVENIDIAGMYSRELSSKIEQAALSDLTRIRNSFPEAVRKGSDNVPYETIIGQFDYCGPYVVSIYASMRVAQDIGANCLFDSRVNEFLKYKYGLEYETKNGGIKTAAYDEIFKALIPNETILPEYVTTKEEHCSDCKNYSACSDKYLSEIEVNLKNLLRWRTYDEIFQAKDVIEDIIMQKGRLTDAKQTLEIKKDFEDRQQKINVNLNRRFPQIKRWTNLVTVVSKPLLIYSALSGDTTSSIISVAATGVATAIEKGMEVYASKNNWVGFFDENAK